MGGGHHHAELTGEARALLADGLRALVRRTEGLAFVPLPSERFPLPLCLAVDGRIPDPGEVRARVLRLADDDPAEALEPALVLAELAAGNDPAQAAAVPADPQFLSVAFDSKRLNGWLAQLGGADPAALKAAVAERWTFRFAGPGLYPLLNLLVRYAFVYGRIAPGDPHALAHFLDEFGQGVLVCRGALPPADLALSLAAMKLGVPAVVPPDYPFTLGRRIVATAPEEIAAAVGRFPGVRRLLAMPGLPPLPDCVDPRLAHQRFDAVTVWGDTPESFFLLRKGRVESPGTTVEGTPAGPLGVVLTAEAEPLDAGDRAYIEAQIVPVLSRVKGVAAELQDGRLRLALAPDHALDVARIGEVLVAALRHEFPRIAQVAARVIGDPAVLAREAAGAQAELAARAAAIAAETEESVEEFGTCVGCAPFAPDHVCVLTPERPPKCGREYRMILTGARYGYDDMTSIHHRSLHEGMNSFGTCRKGESLDAHAGEWSGVNAAVSRLSGGRTRRFQLHRLTEFPNSGCGCFGLILFETAVPRPGVGIIHRGYAHRAPDGRNWWDLHYALAGKQAPGLTGASAGYLASGKFLAGHGGWPAVVWVTPRVAELAGPRLPSRAEVGPPG